MGAVGDSTGYTTDGADAPGWDLDPDDDSSAVIEAVGRQLKLWREAGELGAPAA